MDVVRAAAVGGVGLVALGSALVLSPQVWVGLQSQSRLYAVSTVPDRDVALVLGAGLNDDGSPSSFLQGRLDRALELWRAHKVKVLIVSGDNRFPSYDEPSAMRDALVRAGVPEWAVVRDFAGRNTFDSCYRARHIFGVRSLTVVSQTYHLPRAIALCRGLGIDAVGVGDDSVRGDSHTWWYGVAREQLANVKAAVMVTAGQSAEVGGSPESSVKVALERARREGR